MTTWFEKRLIRLSKEKRFNIKSMDDLRAYYDSHTNQFLESLKGVSPLKYVSLCIDWNKVRDDYRIGADVLIQELGAEMIKEFEVCNRVRNLSEKHYEELPQIIADVYGSLGHYGHFGTGLMVCSRNLGRLVEQRKYSMVEKFTLKPAYLKVVGDLRCAGDCISQAWREIHRRYR